MIYKRVIFLLATFLLVENLQCLYAQNKDQDYLQSILEKSQKEILGLRSATYRAYYSSDDDRNKTSKVISASIHLEKLYSNNELNAKVKMDIEWVNKQDTTKGVLFYDGEKETSYSVGGNKVRVFNYPAVLTGNVIGNLVDNFFISNEPFENTFDKINDFEIKPSEMVDGEPCYVLTFYFPDTEYLTDVSNTWYISKNDYLPRIHISKHRFNGHQKVTKLRIEDLNVNPFLSDSIFTLSAFPKGYKIEQKADREATPKQKLLKKGTQAPGWSLKNGNNDDIKLNDYKGKIIIIDFWGTWCPPCWKAMPELQQIHETYDDITVLGISTNEPTNAEPIKFARNRDIAYPILLEGEKIVSDYHISSFPTFYIIDKNGKIIYSAAGYGKGTGKKIKEVLDKSF